MRIIDAKQAEENLRDTVRKMGFGAFILSRCIRAVRDCPTIEAEPVRHGRWLDDEFYMFCSVCGMQWYYCDNETQDFKFCPHCGCKMDGDDDATN